MNATDAIAAVFGSLLSLLLFAGLYVWTALALSAVFRKSGVEPWKAWVPILNLVVLLQLAGFSPWLVVLAFIPIANIAFLVIFAIALYRLNVAFGYGAGMTVVGILLFPVWASIVGWGSARWVGRERGAGVRRSGQPSEPAPLPPFPAPRSGEPGAFAHPSPAPAGATAFAPPLSSVPAAPATQRDAPAPATPSAGGAPAGRASADAAPVPQPAAPAPQAAAAPPVGVAPPAAAASADPLLDVAPPAGGWTPPPLPGRPVAAASTEQAAVDQRAAEHDVDPWQGFALDSTDMSAEVTGAVPGAPAPISAVPAASAPSAPVTPPLAPAPVRRSFPAPESATTGDGATPPVTRVPAAPAPDDDREPWAPARSPMGEADAFPEASGPVSAIIGAPDAGAPRSARSSVSAFHTRPEIPDEQDILDETVIARRKRTDWTLVPPTGAPVMLSADVVILGRRPATDPAFPGAQLVAIQDGTVSKTHARLQLRDDRWYVTDLDSTNGVLFATVMGTEVEAPPGEEVEAGDRFLLGDAEVRLQRSDG